MSAGASAPSGSPTADKDVGEKERGRSEDGEEEEDLELHELAETANFLKQGDEHDDDEHDDAVRPPMRGRSFSTISFQFNMLPLPLSRDVVDLDEQSREVKHLNLVGGISLVVGLQIGSGIFSSPVRAPRCLERRLC